MNEQNRDGLKQQLVEAIDVVDFIRSNGYPQWSGDEQEKLQCPLAESRHEAGDDSSASLSINPATGAFNCFGCGWKGTSIVGYACDVLYGGDFNRTLGSLYSKHVRQTISSDEIEQAHTHLMRKPKLVQKIEATRGWNEDTLRKFKIGWDSDRKRTVIPITNLVGFVVDVRFHDTLYRADLEDGKRVSSKGNRDSRTGDYFPLSPNSLSLIHI